MTPRLTRVFGDACAVPRDYMAANVGAVCFDAVGET